MQKATLIYNPLAGPINLTGAVGRVADFWQARGWRTKVEPTQYPGHAAILARQAAESGTQLVLAAGGDGTLGEVANGLAGSKSVMAPLPVGTANSFARELRLPRPGFRKLHPLFQTAEALSSGLVQEVDLGLTLADSKPDHYWLLWAGTGADGFLVDRIEPRPRWSKRLGPLDYALRGLTIAAKLPRMQAVVTVDGRQFIDDYLLIVISNCRLYAGGELLLSPDACLDDGRFEIWLFPGSGLKKVIHYLALVRHGRHLDDSEVTMIHGRSVTIRTTPIMPCQTDGDKAGQTPYQCEIRPAALKLLVPETTPAGLFCRPAVKLATYVGSLLGELN